MNTIKLLVAVSFVLALSACASTRKGSSRFDKSKSVYVKEEPKKVAVKEEPKVAVREEPAPRPVQQAPIVVREERVTQIEHAGPSFRFYVIIGSFQVLDNARNFRTQLTAEQFMPVILENENGFYRVSVAAFNEEQPARDRIAQIRNNYDKYNDVWLLKSTR